MMKQTISAAIAAAALTGCITSSGPTYNVMDPYMFFQSAARGGQFPVMIAGQPYPGQQGAVEAAVLNGFDVNFSTYGKAFKVTPVANAPYHRWVVVFNLPGRMTGNMICANSEGIVAGTGSGGAAGETVYASAAYCGGNEVFSSSWVSFPNPGSADSEAFRKAMAQLVMESVPRDPDPTQARGNQPRVP